LVKVDVREELIKVVHKGFGRWTISPYVTGERVATIELRGFIAW
jgi:hypothetical protein